VQRRRETNEVDMALAWVIDIGKKKVAQLLPELRKRIQRRLRHVVPFDLFPRPKLLERVLRSDI
jgi:hypothetical protein